MTIEPIQVVAYQTAAVKQVQQEAKDYACRFPDVDDRDIRASIEYQHVAHLINSRNLAY